MKLPSRNHSQHRTNYHRPLQNRLKSQIISTTNLPQKSLISKRPLAIIDIWVTYYAYLYISWRSVDLLQSTKSTLQNSSDDEFAIDYYWIELNIKLFILTRVQISFTVSRGRGSAIYHAGAWPLCEFINVGSLTVFSEFFSKYFWT